MRPAITAIAQDKSSEKKKPDAPRNYENPDALNMSLKGKGATIQLSNGRIESGKLTRVGQYFLELAMPNGKSLIINKAQIVTVTVM